VKNNFSISIICFYLCRPKNKIKEMANHESAKKRVRQIAKKRLHNRYYKKSARTAIQKLRTMTDQEEASAYLPKVISMIDKLAKKNTWHKNKASNLKKKLTLHVSGIGSEAGANA
jgi:small subunit ribosomal protein S20